MEKFLIANVNKEIISKNKGRFVMQKLDRGFGNTLGNSLRRTLLSSIPSLSTFAIKGKGILHEFQPLNNVKEDVVELILNIKNIVFKVNQDIIGLDEIFEIRLISKEGEVKAKDIDLPTGIEVVNKDFVIAHTTKDRALDITMYATFSKGYKTFEENEEFVKKNLGEISNVVPIDSIFSPIKNVSYSIEVVNPGETRLFEKLVLDIETKGNISPEDALSKAASILKYYYESFSNIKEIEKTNEFFVEEKNEEENYHLQAVIEELNLSSRSEHALKLEGINTIEDLIDRTISSLRTINNLGEKSLQEIISAINELGLSFRTE